MTTKWTGIGGKLKAAVAVLLVGVLATGCITQNAGNKELAGSLLGAGLGAGLGGWAGSKVGSGKGQLAAVAVGALAGGLLGQNIGQSLDRADRLHLGRAQSRAEAAPLGETIAWSNPDSGNYGNVTPTRDGYDRTSGAYCREYHTEVYIGGERRDAWGTSCRQPDGSWRIVSAD